MGVKRFLQNRSGMRIDNSKTTRAATLTLRQSLYPLGLVTILFFLWVCMPLSFPLALPSVDEVGRSQMNHAELVI